MLRAAVHPRTNAPAASHSSNSRPTTVPPSGRSDEKLEVVQPCEHQLAREGVERPETRAVVHIDLEAGRLFEFFSNALNQLFEAAPVKSRSRMSVKTWSHARTTSKAVASGGLRGHGQQNENLCGVSGRRSGVHRCRRAGVLRACPHSGCKRASRVKEVFADAYAEQSNRLNRGVRSQGRRSVAASFPTEARVRQPLLELSQRSPSPTRTLATRSRPNRYRAAAHRTETRRRHPRCRTSRCRHSCNEA